MNPKQPTNLKMSLKKISLNSGKSNCSLLHTEAQLLFAICAVHKVGELFYRENNI